MSHSGSCLCGAVTYTFEGEPTGMAVCHCIACRKTSSCSASNNYMVPAEKFKLQGQTRDFTRKGDSGKNVTYTSCATCPTIITVTAEAFSGTLIVKPATVDDDTLLNQKRPDIEIYTKNRYKWVKAVEGAEQKDKA